MTSTQKFSVFPCSVWWITTSRDFYRHELPIKSSIDCWCWRCFLLRVLMLALRHFPEWSSALCVAARPGQDVELQSWEISRFLAPLRWVAIFLFTSRRSKTRQARQGSNTTNLTFSRWLPHLSIRSQIDDGNNFSRSFFVRGWRMTDCSKHLTLRETV